MSKNFILFVFEGEVTEKCIFDSLKTHYIDNHSNILISVYKTHIYELFREIYEDNDLDIFSLIKSRNEEVLKGIKSSQISEIYYFFDYDGHVPIADDTKLQLLLEYFNEETENGKLYISYPMVEAIRHIGDGINFKDLVAKSSKKYKELVHDSTIEKFKNISTWDKALWDYVCKEHLTKASYLVHDTNVMLENISQELIFKKQLEKYLINGNVAVLSAFPIFIIDYYGYSKFF